MQLRRRGSLAVSVDWQWSEVSGTRAPTLSNIVASTVCVPPPPLVRTSTTSSSRLGARRYGISFRYARIAGVHIACG